MAASVPGWPARLPAFVRTCPFTVRCRLSKIQSLAAVRFSNWAANFCFMRFAGQVRLHSLRFRCSGLALVELEQSLSQASDRFWPAPARDCFMRRTRRNGPRVVVNGRSLAGRDVVRPHEHDAPGLRANAANWRRQSAAAQVLDAGLITVERPVHALETVFTRLGRSDALRANARRTHQAESW